MYHEDMEKMIDLVNWESGVYVITQEKLVRLKKGMLEQFETAICEEAVRRGMNITVTEDRLHMLYIFEWTNEHA